MSKYLYLFNQLNYLYPESSSEWAGLKQKRVGLTGRWQKPENDADWSEVAIFVIYLKAMKRKASERSFRSMFLIKRVGEMFTERVFYKFEIGELIQLHDESLEPIWTHFS